LEENRRNLEKQQASIAQLKKLKEELLAKQKSNFFLQELIDRLTKYMLFGDICYLQMFFFYRRHNSGDAAIFNSNSTNNDGSKQRDYLSNEYS
jgi:hypothetical protein